MKTSLNLLPWRCRQTQLLRLRWKQWRWPCCLTAAAVAVLFVIETSRYVAARQRLDELQRQHLPLETLESQLATLRDQIGRQSRELEAVRRLEGAQPPLTLLGMVSRSARDCQGQLRVDTLSLHPAHGAKAVAGTSSQPKTAVKPASNETKAEAKPAAEADGDAALVTIKGIALDNLAVARFVAALRQTKAFRRVELKSTKEQPLGACRVCSYLVECGY